LTYRVSPFFNSYSLALLTVEADPFQYKKRNITDLIINKYHGIDKTKPASIFSALPYCMNLIWKSRSFLVSTSSGVHPHFNDIQNYKIDSSRLVSVTELKFLKDHDNCSIEVSLIVSAIHLILGYCSRHCKTPYELEVMIDELANVLEIPSDGTLMKDFPVDYLTKQLKVDRLPQKLTDDLPEILLILQATNHALEIVKDMKKGPIKQ
jgi:hypothetical protein